MRPHPTEPISRPAFIASTLDARISESRAMLLQAKNAVRYAATRADKDVARRAVKASATALAVAEAARAAEEHGEKVAPSVQRREHGRTMSTVIGRSECGAPIRGDRHVVIREPRVAVTSGADGKRAELQSAIALLFKRGSLDARTFRAAQRYRRAWETAGMDAYPIGMAGGDGGHCAPGSGNRRIEDAVGSSEALQAARHAVGMFGAALLDHVVVHELTVSSWAQRHDSSPAEGMGYLKMVLVRLAEHWETGDMAKTPRRKESGIVAAMFS